MEKFTDHCASLCSSSTITKQSRLNFAIVSALLASICFLSLRFSPSFLTLLLLIPSILFLANKKSDSNPIFSIHNDHHHLFHEKPQTAVEELSSDDGSSSHLWMYRLDELPRNLPFSSDDSSSEDDDDSLIEIPLRPNSNAIRNLETRLSDLLPDSVLKQHGFVELNLEEINEEDNLIEIDISRGFNRGSTVCK